MESEQDYQTARIIFLKEFTEEIIFNLAEEHKTKRKINIEKLKQKFLNSPKLHSEEFKKIVNHKVLNPIKYLKTIEKKSFDANPFVQNNLSQQPVIEEIPKKIIESIKPEYQPRPQELNLGKLEPILQDPMVQSLECPGPGKNILVNKFGKINVAKIVLAREDINEIIENFSNLAQIPLVDGMLKAAVGNMMISAVTSEIVGSRFIINRINPQVNIQKP